MHQYRGEKISKGRRAIRQQRYFYQPNDLVKYDGKIFSVKGTHCSGARVILKENSKSINISDLIAYRFSKGIVWN